MLCPLSKKKWGGQIFYISPYICHFQCYLFFPVNLSYQNVISFWSLELAGLPATESLSLYLKMSFSSSFLVDSFAAYRILGWQFSSVYIFLSFNSLLVSTVSGDKSAVIVWMLPYIGGVIFLLLLPRFSLFLWLATVWLCTGMELSVFMLLEVCWDSWTSFSSNTFLAIISLNDFCVCVAPTMAATLG